VCTLCSSCATTNICATSVETYILRFTPHQSSNRTTTLSMLRLVSTISPSAEATLSLVRRMGPLQLDGWRMVLVAKVLFMLVVILSALS
jgi:hypothetical protein